jgi:5'-nucleotidase
VDRVFIDMDGVLADFDGLKKKLGKTADELKMMPDAFSHLEPMPGALDAVRFISDLGFECWICTKPAHLRPHSYSEKASWIMRYLPDLAERVIMTQDKGLVGGYDDVLIDDHPKWANCDKFRGLLIPFDNTQSSREWDRIVRLLHRRGLTNRGEFI